MERKSKISNRKKGIIALLICAAIATAVIILACVHTVRQKEFEEENQRLLARFDEELHTLSRYRDEDGYITSVSVKTNFHIGSRVKDYATQFCYIDIEPVLSREFRELSELQKCRIIYDYTWDITDEYRKVRDSSQYMLFRKEHERGGYLKLGEDHIGFSDWCSVVFMGDGTYQYSRGDYYVRGVKYEVEWDGGTIQKVISPYQNTPSESKPKPSSSSKPKYSYDQDEDNESSVDDQDIESFYLDNKGDFENEEDAWDYLEDEEDEWDY